MTALLVTGLRSVLAVAAAITALLALPGLVRAMDYPDALKRVDHGIRTNPKHVSQAALMSCKNRRDFSVFLYDTGQTARAERSLQFCLDVLEITDADPLPRKKRVKKGPTLEEIQVRAAREVEKALDLEPNVEHGLEIYRDCALCHTPEGWGMKSGLVPQLAGQHRTTIIKQLADIRAGHRSTVLMIPYASVKAIGGSQAVADVAGYIDTLEISIDNGKGPGVDVELGAKIYKENCARCHGETGEGNVEEYVPRIQAQHYNYLVRQFEWIRDGQRRNANTEMVEQIKGFEPREMQAVLDYVSRLKPPEELQAPPGWFNPDFVERATVASESNPSEQDAEGAVTR